MNKIIDGFIQFLRDHEDEIDMACEIYVPTLNNKSCFGCMAGRYFEVPKRKTSWFDIDDANYDVPSELEEEHRDDSNELVTYVNSRAGLSRLGEILGFPSASAFLSLCDLFGKHELMFTANPWVVDYAATAEIVLNDRETIAAIKRGEEVC